MVPVAVYIDVPTLIEDLRSGDFNQGAGYLHRNDKDTYCCLGVACERLTRNGLLTSDAERISSDPGERGIMTSYALDDLRIESRELPFGVKFPEYMGIRGSYGMLPTPFVDKFSKALDLAELNDEGFSFSQIADVLEYLYVNNRE